MSTATTPLARQSKPGKYTIWAMLGLAMISILFTTEYPLIVHHEDPFRAKIIADRFLLIPHALFALTAMLIGPFQFSTRFRQRHLSLHRLMGKIYVISIFITVPMAIWMGFRSIPFPFGSDISIANTFMGVCWFWCTLAAFLTARNRHIAVHRQWMTKSYCFTLNFIFTRVLNFWPAYVAYTSGPGLAVVLWSFTICYLLLPDIYFNWRELTTSRA